MATVGSRIKLLRVQKGWSQQAVADRLQMSVPALSKIECGITDVNLSRLEQIANFFNVEVTELFQSGEPNNHKNQIEQERIDEILRSREEEVRKLQEKVIYLFEQLRRSNKEGGVRSLW